MSDLYFNGKSYYSEENTCGNEVVRSTILQPFQFYLQLKKTCDNESHEKKTKYIHALAADLLHVRTGNLNFSAREASCHPAFMASSRILVTSVSLIYQIDEFFFLFLV